jgi:hypothetical protein
VVGLAVGSIALARMHCCRGFAYSSRGDDSRLPRAGAGGLGRVDRRLVVPCSRGC